MTRLKAEPPPIGLLRVVRGHRAAGPSEDGIELGDRRAIVSGTRGGDLANAVGRLHHAGRSRRFAEHVPERFLRQRVAPSPNDKGQVTTRPGRQGARQHGQDGDRDRLAALFGAESGHAVADMLASYAMRITPPTARIEQNVEPHTLPGADRPAPLISVGIFLGPLWEARPLLALWVLDRCGRIDLDQLG